MTLRYAYREPIDRYVDIPDLKPRAPWNGEPVNQSLAGQQVPGGGDLLISDSSILIDRNFQAFTITVGVTPTLLIQNSFAASYMILNPASIIGLTTSSIGTSLKTTAVAGNSQTASIAVAGFKEAHVYVDITAITGTWSIFAQTYDPVSNKWFDSQALVNGATSTGSIYGFLGSFGMATDMAFRWNPDAAGSMTFTIGVVLKEGMGGSNTGIAQAAFLGGANVTTSIGYPLLEGQKEYFTVDENIGLYGIANQPIPLRLFKVR
jgi:hypothetical protein